MSNVTRLPRFAKTVHGEAEIPISQRDDFDRAMVEIVAGERTRMDALVRDEASIETRAMPALETEASINTHSDHRPVQTPGALSRRRLQRAGLPVRPHGTSRPGYVAGQRRSRSAPLARRVRPQACRAPSLICRCMRKKS